MTRRSGERLTLKLHPRPRGIIIIIFFDPRWICSRGSLKIKQIQSGYVIIIIIIIHYATEAAHTQYNHTP